MTLIPANPPLIETMFVPREPIDPLDLGHTLRDQIAVAVIGGMFARGFITVSSPDRDHWIKQAYEFADVMIKVRNDR